MKAREIAQALADRDYWLRVGAVLGSDVILHGFTGRSYAGFLWWPGHGSVFEISGRLADRILAANKAEDLP